MQNELYHHGILGMKWGVRRFQNKDGTLTPAGIKRYAKDYNKIANKAKNREVFTEERTIPKGTKMYRTTSSDQKEGEGPIYVSYLDVDRNHYKGGYIRNRDNAKKAYEREYTLKEDLKIPSRKEAYDVINDVVVKNSKLFEEAMKGYVDMTIPKGSTLRLELTDSYYDPNKPYDQRDYSEAAQSKAMNKYVKELISSSANQTPEELCFSVCQSLNLAPKGRAKIIGELKKRGYNAMVDEASVGGQNEWVKEGVDPLIIFDSNILNQNSVNKISRREEKKANNADTKWQRKASYSRGAWSAI